MAVNCAAELSRLLLLDLLGFLRQPNLSVEVDWYMKVGIAMQPNSIHKQKVSFLGVHDFYLLVLRQGGK